MVFCWPCNHMCQQLPFEASEKIEIEKEKCIMYKILKRDGNVVQFDMQKIAGAIKKAFDATETPTLTALSTF